MAEDKIDLAKQVYEATHGIDTSDREAEVDQLLKTEGGDKLIERHRDQIEGTPDPYELGKAVERQLKAEREAKVKAEDEAKTKVFRDSIPKDELKIIEKNFWDTMPDDQRRQVNPTNADKMFRQYFKTRTWDVDNRLKDIKGHEVRKREIEEMLEQGFLDSADRESLKLKSLTDYHAILEK